MRKSLSEPFASETKVSVSARKSCLSIHATLPRPSNTGQGRDIRQEKSMRIIRFIRSLLLVLLVIFVSAAAFSQVGISITFGPPALPVYEQPLCPQEGYLWTPGYWAYDDDAGEYYWVPGTWVEAPEIGVLWTPGYWGWRDEGFFFNEGYWGPHVGFYGGVVYGFVYFGAGLRRGAGGQRRC